MANFFEELKRRNVIKSTIAYLVVAWILLQVFTTLLPIVDAPDWILKILTLIMAIGLPVWIIISWIYNISPQGIEKTTEASDEQLNKEITNKRLNVFIIVSLSIAVLVMGLKISGVFSSNSNNEFAIAVLPFVNMSDDAEQEFFSDGISEEIINMLAQVPKLKVMGRTTSFAFKGKNMDLKLIGEQLNVGYLLEGSVRRSGNTLRITAQLINVANGSHMYSEKFDRELEDIFDIQDEISESILSAIKLKLFGEEKVAFLRKNTDNIEAHELYLKSLFHINKFTPDGFIKAIEYLDKAIAIDPNYALAYAQLTFCYTNLLDFNWLASEESLPKAKAAAQKSLELNDKIPESHINVGRILLHQEWNVRDAMAAYKKALAINPNSAEAHVQLAMCLAMYDRCEEAMEHAKIAENLDPISILNIFYTGIIPAMCNNPEAVLANGNKLIEMEPNFFSGHMWAGFGLLSLERYDEAIKELKISAKLNPGTWTLGHLGWAYGMSGDTLQARNVIEKIKAVKGYDRFANNSLATVYLYIGELDTAFKYYDRAREYHEGQLLFGEKILRTIGIKAIENPRYKEHRKKMNVIY